jgi:sec-independent protein translocase protein TatB
MFDIGWSELLVIAVVAIIVVGPKDLPRLMRTFGHYAGKLRRAAADFQRQFEEAVRDTEIDEVRKAMQDFREQTPAVDLRAPIDKPLMVPKQDPTPAPIVASVEPVAPATTVAPKAKPRPRPKRAPATKAAPAKIVSVKAASAGAKATPPKPRPARKSREPKP